MNCETLGEEGLSNLVEAATALATFSLCSRASAISPEQGGRSTFVESSVRTINPHLSIGESRVLNVTPAGSKPSSSGEPSKETFPQLLQSILNDKDVSADVIAWLPNGRAFVILRPDIFMETILPKYMAQDSNRSSPVSPTTISTKYPSFTRKLNRWGFRQVTRGPETGAFHHDLFCRDQPELCLQMFCQRSRNSVNGQKTPKENKSRKPTTATRSSQPIKKRRVSLLTKESLEVMNQAQTMSTGVVTNIQTVESIHKLNTVSEDSQSMRSSVSGGKSPSVEASSLTSPKFNGPGLLLNSGIINNPALVQRAITKRNEEERMRLAKIMLYNSFLQAMNGDEHIV